MVYQFRFIRINPEFDQDYADSFNHGEESEDNIKHLWEDEFEIADAKEVTIKNRSTYVLEGEKEGSSFRYELPNICVTEIRNQSGEISYLGVSQRILKSTDKSIINDVTTFTYFIKGRFDPINPFYGLYVVASDFPEALMDYETDEDDT